MEYTKQNKLETCVERHRADFDLHEPRPELWAALEKQLHGSADELSEPVLGAVNPTMTLASQQLPVVGTEHPVAGKRWAWAEHYSIAAALVVLMLAAGLGEAWKSGKVVEERIVSGPVMEPTGATSYLAPSGELIASEALHNTDARLDTAVRGMETYYASQLADRKAELNQVAPDATADWAWELVELDSSYQQLKRELPRHPQPDVVLTAMNRNLQIRLDMLNQQLELRGSTQPASASDSRGDFALADSRRSSTSIQRYDR